MSKKIQGPAQMAHYNVDHVAHEREQRMIEIEEWADQLALMKAFRLLEKIGRRAGRRGEQVTVILRLQPMDRWCCRVEIGHEGVISTTDTARHAFVREIWSAFERFERGREKGDAEKKALRREAVARAAKKKSKTSATRRFRKEGGR